MRTNETTTACCQNRVLNTPNFISGCLNHAGTRARMFGQPEIIARAPTACWQAVHWLG
ncbi:hypothetical protein [Kingella bonacorsii]|uniref:Uncharacterized protein n=1 Tax=Kingella bonacorsii TaxID=2796361 RepID=A0ABS1BP51_9NEIS|nr:hypothetical protein [Kingella bonacorsii]MBK0395081.1 hypothetical protein [Kingella bonacorsii]